MFLSATESVEMSDKKSIEQHAATDPITLSKSPEVTVSSTLKNATHTTNAMPVVMADLKLNREAEAATSSK